jgi:hypothetical protein
VIYREGKLKKHEPDKESNTCNRSLEEISDDSLAQPSASRYRFLAALRSNPGLAA